MQRVNQLTILFCATLAIASLPLSGCVTKSKADAMAKQAFIAGEKRGELLQSQSHSVWVVGNVRQPVVPWTEDLTLAKAIVAADYLSNRDPGLITVFRNGQPPFRISAQQMLKGVDLPLLAGDRIEIRP
jgi:hypothetical protein